MRGGRGRATGPDLLAAVERELFPGVAYGDLSKAERRRAVAVALQRAGLVLGAPSRDRKGPLPRPGVARPDAELYLGGHDHAA